MKLLGIDYGKRKIGLAISESYVATPYVVVLVKNVEDAVKKVAEVAKVEQVEMVVVGVSDGDMARESMEFGELLSQKLGVEVVFQDETLSTIEAQRLSIAAGKKRKKRRQMEDAYSAAVILQSFLDDD